MLTGQADTPGRRAGSGVPSGLDRVREVVRKDKEARFTALLHHVDVARPWKAYSVLNPRAATGVDGQTWWSYGQDLEVNLRDLHERVHSGPTVNTANRTATATAATAALVGSALAAWLGPWSADPIAAVIDKTLRLDPPVRATRRVAIASTRIGGVDVPAGTVVDLDLAAASRVAGAGDHLTFGHGPRACPGREHALAVAAGVLEAARGCRVVSARPPHEMSHECTV
jgi:hypothetical protein